MTIAIGLLRPVRGEVQPVDDEEAEAGQGRRLGMAGDHPGDDPRADARSFHLSRFARGAVAATTLAPVGGVASEG
jgi:hypothetical protein